MAMKKRYHTVNGMLIGETSSGVRRGYLPDALGSVVATVDDNGAIENTYRYKPYGGLLAKTGTGEDPKFLWVGDSGSRQTGVKFSEAYNRSRHLDYFSGRWSSVDPLWPAELAFVYASASPATQVDPSGLQPRPRGGRPRQHGVKGPCGLTIGVASGYFCCYPTSIDPIGGGPLPTEWLCILQTPRCDKCAKSAGMTLGEYCRAMWNWVEKEPPGSSADWLCAGMAAKSAEAEARRRCKGARPPDKCLHCMVSCLIAKKCGKRAAKYIAWCKEFNDLADCTKGSTFDLGDMDANQDGIDAAPNCLSGCKKYGAK